MPRSKKLLIRFISWMGTMNKTAFEAKYFAIKLKYLRSLHAAHCGANSQLYLFASGKCLECSRDPK